MVKESKAESVLSGIPVWTLFSLVSVLVLAVTKFDALSLFQTAALLLNSFVRLLYPSSYVPAQQSKPDILHSPIFARTLATFAEFAHFLTLGEATDCYEAALYMAIFGETLCWMHLLLQSELLGFLEDFNWAVLHLYTCYMSFHQSPYFVLGLAGPYFLYLGFIHFPDTLKRVWHRPMSLPFKIVTGPIDAHTKNWVTTSMLYQPLCYAVFRYVADNKEQE
eukprot:snap_masked-scaffold_2-processed-gene-27.56-mRNA-1 protein AED:1.00 eAED:1.00 QI:0/-1/0/0/-1/1/1/0/220